ncbi:deoxyribose-phosphate aldolase [Aciduricibacillus chroicocephali]|uniref:Deoxyribose-phosphate aldolase n=1 Tax=Aciduricibacillus chroicocephali TaxID=3054939 RepID=A0ABY9KV12_9BACI|nr:deoxyribose-phosphate aldolase [Bacillaceae bacterium 44XB]
MNNLASYIDHTLLKPDATLEQVEALISEAKEYGFATVCVNPYWVPFASSLLEGTETGVCTVIGFPLGTSSSRTKAFETKQAIIDGATEIDMVINVGELKGKRDAVVLDDIQMVVESAKNRAIVKVIIETALLSDEEKKRACELAEQAGADFVKTSTGFSGGGATVEDIKLMRSTVSDKVQVKASGGIRTYEDAKALIEAGASRLGASSGVALVNGLESSSDY